MLRHLSVSTLTRASLIRNLSTSRAALIKDENPVNSRLSQLVADMPKEEAHLAPLRNQRMERRRKLGATMANTVFFQVLGLGGAPGGVCSLFLHTDHNRYLFNCGEGTQRLSTDQCPSRSLGQLTNILFTSKTWKNIGGFPGMCLTIRASGAPDVRVHGPPGCTHLFEATKKFILLYEFDVIPHDHDKDGVFTDSTVGIEGVHVASSDPPLPVDKPKYSTWDPESADAFNRAGERINRKYSPRVTDEDGSVSSHQPNTETLDQTVMAYVVTIHGKPGALQVEKCAALGIPPGPLYGELKAGRSIVLDDGTTVRSEDVVDAPQKPMRAIVVECPSESFIDNITSNPKLNGDSCQNLQFVFHFTPSGIMETEKYSRWMRDLSALGPSVRHVALNDRCSGFDSMDLCTFNKSLTAIAPSLFSPLQELGNVGRRATEDESAAAEADLLAMPATNGMRLTLRPEVGVDCSLMSVWTTKAATEQSALRTAEARAVMAEAHGLMRVDADRPELPRVTFLGTGSSVPGKYRGVSAILVETKQDHFVLLDCGEGTIVQLHRTFGRERSLEILRCLKAVYVSHLHADHHLGLVGLIQERTEAFRLAQRETEKLYISAPGRIAHFLSFYHSKFEPVLGDAFQVKNEHLLVSATGTQIMYPHVMQQLTADCGLKSISTSRAVHCPNSFCLAFTTEDDFKIVYTGDTRPNEELIDLGRSGGKCPDLLIHEATMEHALLADAKMKKHSTFTEAIRDGAGMGAKYTLLTHFSQRYSKFPLFNEMERFEDVGVAFDNMTVSPRTLGQIRHMFKPLITIFVEEVKYLEDRKEHVEVRNARGNPLRVIDKSFEFYGSASPPKSKKPKFATRSAAD